MTPPADQVKKLARQLNSAQRPYVITAAVPMVYFIALVSDLNRDEAVRTVAILFPPLAILIAGVGTYFTMLSAAKQVLSEVPGERPGARLERILKVPAQIGLRINYMTVPGVGLFVALPALYYGHSLWPVPVAMLNIYLLSALMHIQSRLSFEKLLRSYTIAEFHRYPSIAVHGQGYLWPRQRWYLPYTLMLFVICALVLTATIVWKKGSETYFFLLGNLSKDGAEQYVAHLQASVSHLLQNLALPLLLVGGYLLVNAALSAWRLANHQAEGAKAVQEAMEALAQGKPRVPNWVSTDEIGDLAIGTAKIIEQLKDFSLSLVDSAQELRRSAEELGLSTTKQTEVLTLQATALQETQVTAQEIKQTSALASQKAESVLQQTERADEISSSGEAAVQRSLNGLHEIGEQVREMAKRIKALDDRTRQIANITTTVKDLADQSNMLALNAAIEAVRSGEHGKGFGVVAREIRALADQSIQATNSVREILQDISSAITTTVSITEKGSEKIESSLIQIKEFGSNMRQLSGIVRDNAASVRQITAAVTQQNAGIGQIFQAVSDLSKIMDQTMTQLRASDQALALVRTVAERVSSFVGNYSWKAADGAPNGKEKVEPRSN